MTDMTHSSYRIAGENATLKAITTMTAAAVALLREWRHNYRSRRELAMYSRHERSDLSFTANVDSEIAKPFWKK